MNWIKKIGIIDVLIIAVLVAAMFYLIKPFKSKGNIGYSTKPIVYTFESNDVGEEFINQLEIGREVFNSSKNYYLGKIKDFRVKPYTENVENLENGTIIIATHGEKYAVEIDIEANAIIENDVILVDMEEIRVGLYVPIKGKSFASYGYIINIAR